MKLAKTKRLHSIGFNMTPMIDIVFLLIIFFMTVSQITRVADHPVDLSRVTRGATKSITVSLTINLDREGKIMVAGKPINDDQTLEWIQRKLKQVNNDPNRVKLELRCDRSCPSQRVNQLVNRLSSLGFRKIYAAVAGEN